MDIVHKEMVTPYLLILETILFIIYLLVNERTLMKYNKENTWEAYFLHKATKPETNSKQIGFLHIKGFDKENEDNALSILSGFFNALESFMVTKDTATLILEDWPTPFDDGILEIIDLMAFDLNLNIQVLIGHYHKTTSELFETFHKEHDYLKILNTPLEIVSNLYIQNTLVENLSIENLYPTVYEVISKDNETRDVILKLWETGGNVVQSATELFVHRNTLLYRINKFQKETELNLRQSNDLLIAYLITLRYLCKQ